MAQTQAPGGAREYLGQHLLLQIRGAGVSKFHMEDSYHGQVADDGRLNLGDGGPSVACCTNVVLLCNCDPLAVADRLGRLGEDSLEDTVDRTIFLSNSTFIRGCFRIIWEYYGRGWFMRNLTDPPFLKPG